MRSRLGHDPLHEAVEQGHEHRHLFREPLPVHEIRLAGDGEELVDALRPVSIQPGLGPAEGQAAVPGGRGGPQALPDAPGRLGDFAEMLSERDPYTAEHSDGIVATACTTARALGASTAELLELRLAAPLHDLGKIRVPSSILAKPGPLTARDRLVIDRHPVWGAELLACVPGLEVVAGIVRFHHERWDGTGYPDGLSGARIPLASRIIAACDAYHAMTSDRPYRRAMSAEQAISELRANAGSQFDPQVVAELEKAVDRWALTV